MTPEDLIRMKQIYSVALTTEQVDALSEAFRLESAWIVGVDEASIIKAYYDVAEQLATGELSDAEARRAVRGVLKLAGYEAEKPGSWGDLADGTARQKLILETNVSKAASYAWHEAVKGSEGYPAQRLVRLGARRAPRDWQKRWQEAYAALPPEEKAKAHPTQMVATVDCAIWRALSRWSDPYPPFDYNSGMGVEPVSAEEAAALGLTRGEPNMEPDSFTANDHALPDDLPFDVTVEIEDWIGQ